MALNNLGTHYSQVGSAADAIASHRTRRHHPRGLAAENPAFLPDLASSLNSLGHLYATTGDADGRFRSGPAFWRDSMMILRPGRSCGCVDRAQTRNSTRPSATSSRR